MFQNLEKYFPGLSSMVGYDRKLFRSDLFAGLTVAVMLIPQGMAYAMIAGIPPIYGLYTAIVPLLIYALLGTCRQFAVGPSAMIALLVAAGLSKHAAPNSEEFVGLVLLLSICVGLLQFLMGIFRLGFTVQFLSHPVVSGFTSAAAVLIICSQIRHLLGVEIDRIKHIQDLYYELAPALGDIHLSTVLVGLSAVILLLALKAWKPLWPAALIAVIYGIGLAFFASLEGLGVSVLGQIPKGLPTPHMPDLNLHNIQLLLPATATIALVGFVESAAIFKTIQMRHKENKVDSDRELIALGLSSFIGGIFQAFPVTGSFSRTAVMSSSGAKTNFAGVISAVVIALILLFFTRPFYYLPKAVLAAVIVVAVSGLFGWKEMKHLWHTDKKDLAMLLVTFITTLTVGVEAGILSGVILSLSLVIYSSSRPHYAILGRLPGTSIYRNIDRYREATEEKGVLIIRPDARLYFANLDYLRKVVDQEYAQRSGIEMIVVNCEAVAGVDSSGIKMMIDLVRDYNRMGVRFRFLGMIGPVRDVLRRNGLSSAIDLEHAYTRVSDIVAQYHAEKEGLPIPGVRAVTENPVTEIHPSNPDKPIPLGRPRRKPKGADKKR